MESACALWQPRSGAKCLTASANSCRLKNGCSGGRVPSRSCRRSGDTATSAASASRTRPGNLTATLPLSLERQIGQLTGKHLPWEWACVGWLTLHCIRHSA
eukprot:9491073-Pyramimonas_sp.AAC.1